MYLIERMLLQFALLLLFLYCLIDSITSAKKKMFYVLFCYCLKFVLIVLISMRKGQRERFTYFWWLNSIIFQIIVIVIRTHTHTHKLKRKLFERFNGSNIIKFLIEWSDQRSISLPLTTFKSSSSISNMLWGLTLF